MVNWTKIIAPYKKNLLIDLEKTITDSFSQRPPEAPFGQGIQEALNYMLDLGKRDGFITKDVDHYAGHLEIGQGEKLLGILSQRIYLIFGTDEENN